MRTLQPEGWTGPRGYSSGIAVRGTLVLTAGLTGWNARRQFKGQDFVQQVRQALQNIVGNLAVERAQPHHVVRLTWYITDKRAHLERQRETGQADREIMGRHKPTMSAAQVSALLQDTAMVEIEAPAVIPGSHNDQGEHPCDTPAPSA